MKDKKTKRIDVRLSEMVFKKLLAICGVTGCSTTRTIENLIENEYRKDSKYWNFKGQ